MEINYILNYPYVAIKKFFSFYPEIRAVEKLKANSSTFKKYPLKMHKNPQNHKLK